MKWCLWSGGSWVWLVVMTIIPHASYQQCTLDDVRVNGIKTDVFEAGRIEVSCSGSSNWKSLCGDRFDETCATKICTRLEFPMAALYRTDSCLGSGRGDRNVQLNCPESASDIDDCTITPSTTCASYAGVICYRDSATCQPFTSPSDTTPSCDCATHEGQDVVTTPTQCANACHPEKSTNHTTTATVGGEDNAGSTAGGNSVGSTDPMVVEDHCTALGGGLGILSAVLAILLVGVVLGWVWSCHRRKGKSGIHERSSDPTVTSNPSYTSTPHTSIQYSSIGPRDTPTNNGTPTYAVVNEAPSHDATPTNAVVNKAHAPIPPGGEGDRIYHVLEAPGEGGVADYGDLDEEEGGGDYHMLGEEGGEGEGQTYEVPVSSSQNASP